MHRKNTKLCLHFSFGNPVGIYTSESVCGSVLPNINEKCLRESVLLRVWERERDFERDVWHMKFQCVTATEIARKWSPNVLVRWPVMWELAPRVVFQIPIGTNSKKTFEQPDFFLKTNDADGRFDLTRLGTKAHN